MFAVLANRLELVTILHTYLRVNSPCVRLSISALILSGLTRRKGSEEHLLFDRSLIPVELQLKADLRCLEF